MSKRDPEVLDGDQALLCQPSIGHGELRGLGARQVPRAAGATPRGYRVVLGHTHRQEIADPRSGSAPLHPVAHPDPAANPVIDLRNRPVVLADPKVPHPPAQVAATRLAPLSVGDVAARSAAAHGLQANTARDIGLIR